MGLLTLDAAQCRGLLSYPEAVAALRQGHKAPRAQLRDSFISDGDGVLLSRAASVEGLGQCVKTVTVRKENPDRGLPSVQGGLMLFDPDTGALRAMIDSAAVTNLKTVADSLLGAEMLARPDSTRLLIIGTGSLAASLAEGYAAFWRSLAEIEIFGRDPEKVDRLIAQVQTGQVPVSACRHLPEGLAKADIVATATSSIDPVLPGALVRPGTHLDLVGAYRADMREADDEAIRRATLYVDCRETTLHDIGEIAIPIANGVIRESDIRQDYYDLVGDGLSGRDRDEITLCKNGGGAHLDLMIGNALLAAWLEKAGQS